MTTPNLDGIDTSHYQALTGAPLPTLTFAMHKASEGAKGRDDTLARFIGRYRAAHSITHVGAYHWLRFDATVEAQAENFLTALGATGGLQPGEFAVCDWERTYVNVTERQGPILRRLRTAIPDPTPADVERWCALVGAEVGAHRVAVYSAPWVTGFAEWRRRNPTVALFLANYRTSRLLPLNGWAESARWDTTAWQWSSTGHVPGIGGNCDRNHVWKPEWFAALGGTVPTPLEEPMYVLIELEDAGAKFIGLEDSRGRIYDVEWTGPGNNPVVEARIAFLGDDKRTKRVADLALCTLHGPRPVGDTKHTWTGAEFYRVVD